MQLTQLERSVSDAQLRAVGTAVAIPTFGEIKAQFDADLLAPLTEAEDDDRTALLKALGLRRG
jgi:hypothetical protein